MSGDHHPVLAGMWGPLGRGELLGEGGNRRVCRQVGVGQKKGPGYCVLCLPSLDPQEELLSPLCTWPFHSVCVAEQEVVCLKEERVNAGSCQSRRGPYTSLASSRSFTEAMVNVLVFLWRMSCLLALLGRKCTGFQCPETEESNIDNDHVGSCGPHSWNTRRSRFKGRFDRECVDQPVLARGSSKAQALGVLAV